LLLYSCHFKYDHCSMWRRVLRRKICRRDFSGISSFSTTSTRKGKKHYWRV